MACANELQEALGPARGGSDLPLPAIIEWHRGHRPDNVIAPYITG
jgi:hypothetical protein